MGKLSKVFQVFRCFSNPIAVISFLRHGLPKGEVLLVGVRSGSDFVISRNADRWLVESILAGGSVETTSCATHGDCIAIEGLKLRQGTADPFIYKELFLDDVYGERLDALNPNDVVLDIGTHIGLFSIRAAERGCQVHAYEAHSANHALAAENIRSRGVSGVHLSHRALWSTTGDLINILDPGQGRTAEYSVQEGEGIGNDGQVETISLEDVFKQLNGQPVSLLKMDIEGAEYEVLLKAPLELFAQVEAVCIEYHVDPSGSFGPVDLEQFFSGAGLVVQRTVINDVCGLILGSRTGWREL